MQSMKQRGPAARRVPSKCNGSRGKGPKGCGTWRLSSQSRSAPSRPKTAGSGGGRAWPFASAAAVRAAVTSGLCCPPQLSPGTGTDRWRRCWLGGVMQPILQCFMPSTQQGLSGLAQRGLGRRRQCHRAVHRSVAGGVGGSLAQAGFGGPGGHGRAGLGPGAGRGLAAAGLGHRPGVAARRLTARRRRARSRSRPAWWCCPPSSRAPPAGPSGPSAGPGCRRSSPGLRPG